MSHKFTYKKRSPVVAAFSDAAILPKRKKVA